MSVNYSDALSPYPNKGRVGMKEYFDDDLKLSALASSLAELMKNSRHTVVICGAGISTAAGIPDFRGPNGVWTLQKKGLKPITSIPDFISARPTFTHQALVAMQNAGLIGFVISQNIDGLLHRTGFPLNRLAEVHGNVFMERCRSCGTVYVRQKSVAPTMTQQPTGRMCVNVKTTSSRRLNCRGALRDTVLDWEDELPEPELSLSLLHCRSATLCLCLGTSLQIYPVAGMPGITKKQNGNVAIVNLQKTRCDSLADIRIHAPVDKVMQKLTDLLGIAVPTESNGCNVSSARANCDDKLPVIEHNFVVMNDL